MNYIGLYSTTLMVSFVLTVIFFIYHSRYWNTATRTPLKCIYLLNMTSCLMCIVWVLVDGKPEWIPVNYIGNIIEFNCLSFCGYFWLRYCLLFVDIPVLKTKKAMVLMTLPIVVVMLLIVTTPITHLLFYIDEKGYFYRGSAYFFQQTSYVYLCFCSVICLIYRRKVATSYERRRITILAMFPLSPAVFGSIQIIAPSGAAPTLQFSIIISLIMVFVDELDQRITRDSLTHLMNRYEFERVLHSKVHGYQKHGPRLFLLMSDMDNFKKINDNFGHMEGDRALQLVSQVLVKTAADYHAVWGRVSGDEFISLLEADSMETAQAYRTDITNHLSEACRELPYTLSLSIGIAEYETSMTPKQLADLADDRMYEQKKLHKARAI